MQQNIIAAIISAAIVIAAAYLGVTSYFGAHPVFWPVQVAVIGAPIGALIALLAGLVLPSKLIRTILFAALTLAAWRVAHYGKTQFAASYAEDQLAGQFWYFGWIGTCAMATAVLASLASKSKAT